jgi:long-chain acyl-CoA synthetase
MEPRSIQQLFDHVARLRPTAVAYRHKRGVEWIGVTWADCRARVERVSRALIALGVEHGDRVAILAQTRLEWVLCDLGIVGCGGVTVGIYPSSLAPDCRYIVDHSDSVVLFVDDEAQRDKILAVRHELPRLRQIVIFDGPTDAANSVLGWDDFLRRAESVPQDALAARQARVGPHDLASLVYTSGTTGVPKGAMISHGNLLFTSESITHCLPVAAHHETLLFLPLAHVFARAVIHLCLRVGVTVAFAESIAAVGGNLREIRPHFLASVPRTYEKVHDKIRAEVPGGTKKLIFEWALGVGRKVSRLQQRNESLPPWLRLRRALAHALVFRKIQAGLGGRLVFAISGSAPLDPAIAEFFHACGILILEGIGMTENTSFSNVNRIDRNKFGTVGPAGPGIEVRIADDGEVLIRAPNVMRGYFKDPQGTAEAVDAEGWLHTGDVGEIDEDGFLEITDRKKDLIVTAGGKNIAPQKVERVLCASPYIGQALAIGDRRRFLTALITLEPNAIAAWARERGIAADTRALAADPRVQELIRAEIARLNRQLASFETVKRFIIAPDEFSIEGGELTPTLKIRRKAVTAKYADQIEGLYREAEASVR